MSAPKTSPIANDAAGAHSLHRLVRPFVRTETARWREREDIRNTIESLYRSLAEVSVALEMDERLQDRLERASNALYEAEADMKHLWPAGLSPCVGTHGTIAHLVEQQDDGTMRCRRCGATIDVTGK